MSEIHDIMQAAVLEARRLQHAADAHTREWKN